jgi:arginase
MGANKLNIIGVAYGKAAGDPGCEEGPLVLAASSHWQQVRCPNRWLTTYSDASPLRGLDAMPVVCQLNEQLAERVHGLCQQQHRFLTLGGDQTCSLGTWSGASASQQSLGLIWLDAHLDAHTPQTTQSGNIHGMPLAALLGHGDAAMTDLYRSGAKLAPENVVVIGARSFEAAEVALLERLGVRIVYMPEICDKGIQAVLQEAISSVTQATTGFGLSLDLDALDPRQVTAVGTPEPEGIDAQALLHALTVLHDDPRLIGAEIVEFNPQRDLQQTTEKLIIDIVNAVFAG